MKSNKNDRPDGDASERSEETIVADEILSGGEDPSLDEIISEFYPHVKDLLQLKELREGTELKVKELLPYLTPHFPKLTRQTFCACENPDQYGVVLHPLAFAILQAKFPAAAISKKKKKSGKNRLQKRISARLEDAEYEALIKKMKSDGFDTVQAFLVFMVRNYLKES